MSKVVAVMTMSLNGYTAGPNQSLEQPFGDGGGLRLHRWMSRQAEQNAGKPNAMGSNGACIMGRNMFGPGRGAWDLEWNGWWGEEPPYHAPVFVLTHHEREPLAMKGGTTFHFVTGGIEAALARARSAAGAADVAVVGGANTVNQYLAAGLVDELRLCIAPVVVGAGERLFDGVGDLDLDLVSRSGTDLVTHVTYRVDR
jgi:dihydrofolate reductase